MATTVVTNAIIYKNTGAIFTGWSATAVGTSPVTFLTNTAPTNGNIRLTILPSTSSAVDKSTLTVTASSFSGATSCTVTISSGGGALAVLTLTSGTPSGTFTIPRDAVVAFNGNSFAISATTNAGTVQLVGSLDAAFSIVASGNIS